MNDKYIEDKDGESYLMLDNPKQFLLENAEKALVGSKIANIKARQGRVGEKVKTIMKNGHFETTNYVSYDPATGMPDWIVTQTTGEEMIVVDSKFNNLYEVPKNYKEGDDLKPSGKYRPMIKVDQNIAIRASWGALQYVKAGGVLVAIDGNDIYGIQQYEFENSYKIIEGVDAKTMLEENLAHVSLKNQPQIFLSVAYPYDKIEDQQLMREIIQYINYQGIKAINIRNITEGSNHLIKDISTALKQSDGILSLAFNKGNGSTSPFIQIETSLASTNVGLAQLMIIPNDVTKEGVLDERNGLNTYELSSNKSLYDRENDELRKKIDDFIDEVVKRFTLKINERELAKFKKGLISTSEKAQTKQDLVKFLQNFYKVHDKNFDFKDIYIKRPTQIKATIIDKDGLYETQDGVIYLKKGDFLVQDIDGVSKPYGVSEQEFKNRYVKVNDEEDTYVSKVIPTIAKEKDGKMEVYNLVSPDDIYSVNQDKFGVRYQTLEDYILNLDDIENDNIQEL